MVAIISELYFIIGPHVFSFILLLSALVLVALNVKFVFMSTFVY